MESWETMQAENIGYLFGGGVGTGKSYLAACIANALMEKEVAVCMTHFATILNDLAASFDGRNEYICLLYTSCTEILCHHRNGPGKKG